MSDQVAFGSVGAEALLSPCRRYRYALWRTWDPFKPSVLFVGLNPSTANEHEDDPTIRRCIGFARSWGYGGIAMGNLYALRATAPVVLHQFGEGLVESPAEPGRNDRELRSLAETAGLVVAAWGANTGPMAGRAEQVLELLGPEIHCLGLTLLAGPRHPLYIRGDARPTPFQGAAL